MVIECDIQLQIFLSLLNLISDFSLIAKLTKEPRKSKDGKEQKPQSPVSRDLVKLNLLRLRSQLKNISCN